MVQKAVPGYSEMFQQPSPIYPELLNEVSPMTGIIYCITLTGELYAPIEYRKNQLRLLIQCLSAFTKDQELLVLANLERLEKERDDSSVIELFHRKYLIAMLVKELNRSGLNTSIFDQKVNQFSIFCTYLSIIEQENNKSRPQLDDAIAKQKLPLSEYPLIWAPLIQQYHFNEWVNPVFEIFKLFCLLKYAFDNWRDYLRVYINDFDIKQIGSLVGSYKSLFDAMQVHHPNEKLQKFIPISRNKKVAHLQYLSINSLIGKKEIAWTDIKRNHCITLKNLVTL